MNDLKFTTAEDYMTWDAEEAARAVLIQDMVVRECAHFIQTLVDQRIPASEYHDRLLREFGL